MPSKHVTLIALSILILAHLYLDERLSRVARVLAIHRERPLSSYTFLEDDYPALLRAQGAKQAVRMFVEESTHYALLDPQSSNEWLWISTVGDGNLRLGPTHRIFAPGMNHQQHCLQYLVDALQAPYTANGDHREHPEHCLNHIRQYVLCDADITLEPPDVLTRNWTMSRSIGDHRCVDWRILREEIRGNWLAWKAVRDRLRMTDVGSSAKGDTSSSYSST